MYLSVWVGVCVCVYAHLGKVQSRPGRVLYSPKAPSPTRSMECVPLTQHSVFSSVLTIDRRSALVDACSPRHCLAACLGT